MIKNGHRSSCKVPIHFYCQILMKLEFSRQVLKKTQISNFMKIRRLGAEFHADRREEADGCFSQFCERT